jgi:hypothetical protein
MQFDTKIAVVVRDDLESWQKLNITAFTVSGIAGTVEGIVGDPYEDGSGNTYLPMFRQPVMVFSATTEQMKKVYERALNRQIRFSIFTEELFQTNNDIDNRAAVKARQQTDLNIVGLALWAEKKSVEKVLKGVSLHS